MLAALAEGWKRDRAMRLDLRDGMATEGNRGYQEGYADALGQCVQAAGEAIQAEAAASMEKRVTDD
jgi:hypothetical protein